MKKTLSKILAVVIAVMLVISAMPIAFAADGDIASGTAGEDVNWVLDAEGTLTISGEGAIVVDWYAPPWQDYNDSILNIVVEEGITQIPSSAFCYAENLLTVSIPASVTDINIGNTPMFWSNSSLQAINVHQDNPAFTSVDGIVFSKDETMLCIYPMNKEGDSYTIPDTVTDINAYAFSFNKTLKSVVIPDTVTELKNDAFYDAEVTSVTIGNGIKTIPRRCFPSCYYLENITISDSVETIEGSAFCYCQNLKKVLIGSGVKTIENDIFEGCDSLTAIHYNGTADTWGEIIIDEENEKLNSLPVHYASDIQYKDAVGTTCTTEGHTAGDYCDICQVYLSGEVTENALGHDFKDGVCQRDDCGYVCEHVNQEFDNICDECGLEIELELPEIRVGETKTAYIEEAHKQVHVKFVPKESGEYILFSDNGGDDENIDPYVGLYDSEFNEIKYSDDDDYGYNFELVFDADKGETYYIVLSSYDIDVEYSYTLDKHIGIGHQPTSGEPYVELTWDMDANYQWYTVDVSETEITDQNADTVVYDWGESSYDAENGWSGVPCYEEGTKYDFFTVSLNANESITVELIGDYFSGVGLWEYNVGKGERIDSTSSNIYELTVSEAGDYTFYTYSHSGDLTVKAYLGELQYTKIEGEDTNTLTSAVIGEKYVCIVTLEDSVFVSSVLKYTYAITHQPTAKELYVKLNDDTDAKYQWYQIKISKSGPIITELDGETGAKLVNSKSGEFYMCEVTFVDGSTEMSHVVGKGYPDTSSGQWYSDAVEYVSLFGIMSGYENGKFGTSDSIQRQDFLVMLARYAGVDLDAYDYDCELTDVADDGYYKAAVNWALSEGITTGYENGKFGVGDKMTREQLVTFLYRYADLIGADTTVENNVAARIAAQYADFGKVSSFSKDAIVWALANGVISGQGGVKIDPQGSAQRCQVAQIMYNIYFNDVL